VTMPRRVTGDKANAGYNRVQIAGETFVVPVFTPVTLHGGSVLDYIHSYLLLPWLLRAFEQKTSLYIAPSPACFIQWIHRPRSTTNHVGGGSGGVAYAQLTLIDLHESGWRLLGVCFLRAKRPLRSDMYVSIHQTLASRELLFLEFSKQRMMKRGSLVRVCTDVVGHRCCRLSTPICTTLNGTRPTG
jgi:hypothetical protein